MKSYFSLALKNLRKRKIRSWLTMLGIVISIATIFILVSLSIGLQQAVNEQFRMLGTDKFLIMPKGQSGGPGSGGAVELTTSDVNIIEKVAGIKEVSYFTISNAKISFNDKTRYYLVIGVSMDNAEVFKTIAESSNMKIDVGRFLNEKDRQVIMIGSLYKTAFGKPVVIGSRLGINDQDFKVIGILKSVGNSQDDQNIYMPYNAAKEFFNTGERVDEIFVQINQGEDIKIIADNVAKKLRTFRGVSEKNQDFTIMTPEQLLESFQAILNIVTGFLIGIAAISLLVGGIGIANTMYTSVLERTREIGTMKAIGAKNSDILSIFLIESGLLGAIGGTVGVIIGIGIGKVIEYIAINNLGTNLLKAYIGLPLILGCIIFAFLLGASFGVLPAYRASKLKPIDALRYE